MTTPPTPESKLDKIPLNQSDRATLRHYRDVLTDICAELNVHAPHAIMAALASAQKDVKRVDFYERHLDDIEIRLLKMAWMRDPFTGESFRGVTFRDMTDSIMRHDGNAARSASSQTEGDKP